MDEDEWTRRRMTDEELLDRALALASEQNQALLVFHQRHGGSPAFEDICCRLVGGEAISVLAEAERRDEENE